MMREEHGCYKSWNIFQKSHQRKALEYNFLQLEHKINTKEEQDLYRPKGFLTRVAKPLEPESIILYEVKSKSI